MGSSLLYTGLAGTLSAAYAGRQAVYELRRLYDLGAGSPIQQKEGMSSRDLKPFLHTTPTAIRVDQTVQDPVLNKLVTDRSGKFVSFSVYPSQGQGQGNASESMSNFHVARGISPNLKVSEDQAAAVNKQVGEQGPAFLGNGEQGHLLVTALNGNTLTKSLSDYLGGQLSTYLSDNSSKVGAKSLCAMAQSYIQKTLLNEKAMRATIDQDRRDGRLTEEQAQSLQNDYLFFLQRQRELQTQNGAQLNGLTPMEYNFKQITSKIGVVGGATFELLAACGELSGFDGGDYWPMLQHMWKGNTALSDDTAKAGASASGFGGPASHFVYLSPVKEDAAGSLRWLSAQEAQEELVPQLQRLLKWGDAKADDLATDKNGQTLVERLMGGMPKDLPASERGAFAASWSKVRAEVEDIARRLDNPSADAQSTEAALQDWARLLARMSASRAYYTGRAGFSYDLQEGASSGAFALAASGGKRYAVYAGDVAGDMVLQLALDDSPARGALFVVPDVPYLSYASDILIQGQGPGNGPWGWRDPGHGTPRQGDALQGQNPYYFCVDADWMVNIRSQLLFHDPVTIAQILKTNYTAVNLPGFVPSSVTVDANGTYHCLGRFGVSYCTPDGDFISAADMKPLELYIPSALFEDRPGPTLVYRADPVVPAAIGGLEDRTVYSRSKGRVGWGLTYSSMAGEQIKNVGGGAEPADNQPYFRKSISGPDIQNLAALTDIGEHANAQKGVDLAWSIDNFFNKASYETLFTTLQDRLRDRYCWKMADGNKVPDLDAKLTPEQIEAFLSEKNTDGRNVLQQLIWEYFVAPNPHDPAGLFLHFDAEALNRLLSVSTDAGPVKLGDQTYRHFLRMLYLAGDGLLEDAYKTKTNKYGQPTYYDEYDAGTNAEIGIAGQLKKEFTTAIFSAVGRDKRHASLWMTLVGKIVEREFEDGLGNSGMYWQHEIGFGGWNPKANAFNNSVFWKVNGLLPIDWPSATIPDIPGLGYRLRGPMGLALRLGTRLDFGLGFEGEANLYAAYLPPVGRDPSTGHYNRDEALYGKLWEIKIYNSAIQQARAVLEQVSSTQAQKDQALADITTARADLKPRLSDLYKMFSDRHDPVGAGYAGDPVMGAGGDNLSAYAGYPYAKSQDWVKFQGRLAAIQSYLDRTAKYAGGASSHTLFDLGRHGITGTSSKDGHQISPTYSISQPLTEALPPVFANFRLHYKILDNQVQSLKFTLTTRPGPKAFAAVLGLLGGDQYAGIQELPQYSDWFSLEGNLRWGLRITDYLLTNLEMEGNILHPWLTSVRADISYAPFGEEEGPVLRLSGSADSPMGGPYMPSMSGALSAKPRISTVLSPILDEVPDWTKNLRLNLEASASRTFLPYGQSANFNNAILRIGISYDYGGFSSRESHTSYSASTTVDEQLSGELKGTASLAGNATVQDYASIPSNWSAPPIPAPASLNLSAPLFESRKPPQEEPIMPAPKTEPAPNKPAENKGRPSKKTKTAPSKAETPSTAPSGPSVTGGSPSSGTPNPGPAPPLTPPNSIQSGGASFRRDTIPSVRLDSIPRTITVPADSSSKPVQPPAYPPSSRAAANDSIPSGGGRYVPPKDSVQTKPIVPADAPDPNALDKLRELRNKLRKGGGK